MKFFNNISLFKKVIAIFILFIFTPIIISSIWFTIGIRYYVKDKIDSQIINSAQNAISNFKKNIDFAINFSYTIYSDKRVFEAINTRYETIEDFYDSYENNIKPILTNSRLLYPQIENLTILCNNPTVLNSDGFIKLDDETQKIIEGNNIKNKNLYVISGIQNEKAFVSLVMNLNFYEQYVQKYGKSNIKKFLKVDLNRVYLNNILSGLKNTHIYIIDNNGIVFFGDTLFYDRIKKFNEISKEINNKMIKVVIDSDLGKDIPYFSGWRLLITANYNEINKELLKQQVYYIIVGIISFVLAFFALLILSNSIVSRLALLVKHIKKAKNQNFEVISIDSGKDEIGETINEFNNMALQIKDLLEREIKYKLKEKELIIEKKQAEINALQNQINPHFLFNTLETIRMRSILKKEIETANAIKLLAKILKRVIRWERDLIQISEEIAAVKDYLEIQKYRFGDKLEFNIFVEEKAMKAKIPKMTLQPLVENSCVHGLENSKDKGIVTIDIYENGNNIYIISKDNGIGIEEQYLYKLIDDIKNNNNNGQNIGLKNIYKRLNLFFDDKFEFDIKNNELGGVNVIIKIPFIWENDNV
ncbi:sensor histidine kinase [Caldicellulosiruptoraceae bacterium PP1]